MATITSTYNGWLPQNILTMDAYHNNYLLWTVAIASTYNERYHGIYLQ